MASQPLSERLSQERERREKTRYIQSVGCTHAHSTLPPRDETHVTGGWVTHTPNSPVTLCYSKLGRNLFLEERQDFFLEYGKARGGKRTRSVWGGRKFRQVCDVRRSAVHVHTQAPKGGGVRTVFSDKCHDLSKVSEQARSRRRVG